jgi:hypothetical protein
VVQNIEFGSCALALVFIFYESMTAEIASCIQASFSAASGFLARVIGLGRIGFVVEGNWLWRDRRVVEI